MGFGIQSRLAKAIFPFNNLLTRYGPAQHYLQTLIYHRIGDRVQLWPEPSFLAEGSLEQFEEQMAWLSIHCTPVTCDQVWRIMVEGETCPSYAVLVTFDDGYREDLFRVLPCIKRTGIRPIVFLPTDYVGTRKRFWWDRIGVAVQTSTHIRLTLPCTLGTDLPLKTTTDRDQAINSIIKWAKKLSAAERDHFISQVENNLGVPDGTESPRPSVLSWEEARELRDYFDFGAHTTSHEVLSRLSPEAIRNELGRSREIIEEKLGQPCTSLAIPFGGKDDYTMDIIDSAKQTGINIIFSFEESNRPPLIVDRTVLLDRITLHPNAGVASLAAKVIWPRIFIPHWLELITECLERHWK